METHLELVALDPRELATAQADLVTWCRARIGELINERADAEERLRVTQNTALHTDAFTRQVSRAKREITYYQKLMTALEAGYLIIPNLPLSVFAVRTNRAQPPQGEYEWASQVPDVAPMALPQGEGRYVSPSPDSIQVEVERWNTKEEKMLPVLRWQADDFRDIAFPVALVKPTILDATNRALALKLFDEIGLVGPERARVPTGDPIVVGRIRHPARRNWAPRVATFFIAWWLDTRRL